MTPAWPRFSAAYRRQSTFRWPLRTKCDSTTWAFPAAWSGWAVTAQRAICGITRRV
jgi:hypothetical protein